MMTEVEKELKRLERFETVDRVPVEFLAALIETATIECALDNNAAEILKKIYTATAWRGGEQMGR